MAEKKLDEYTLKARVFPAFLVLLPLGIFAGQFVGLKSMLLAACSGFGGTLLLSFVLAQWSREAGKKREAELWGKWGGKPTTVYLRHRTTEVNQVLRTRYRRRLERISPGIILPTVRAEEENPTQADCHYDSAVKVLIAKTRDKDRFSILFQELIDYGFRRNSWGLKPVAIVVSSLSLISSVVFWIIGLNRFYNEVSIACSLLALAIWIFTIRPEWVRRGAERYTGQLFSCLDDMPELD